MEASNNQIGILHRISSIVASELSLDEMLGEIIGLTSQVTGCDACLVYLIEPESGEIVLRASQLPHAADLGNLRMKMGEGVTGWVASHRKPAVITAGKETDPRYRYFPELGGQHYTSMVSVPMESGVM